MSLELGPVGESFKSLCSHPYRAHFSASISGVTNNFPRHIVFNQDESSAPNGQVVM